MPRAEVGSTKHISNQMKQKGLTRLRWYCQTCEKACRDENGFKCHVMSESHVRNIQAFGDDARKVIQQNSNQFLSDFIKLLRTSHGEKKVDANHFYQEYIRDRHHMHQNATKWASLTEIVKHLGREGICRVEGKEEDAGRDGRGFMISWIDNSPEALRRQDALRRKERQDKGDEERELQAINEQIRRAKRDVMEEEEDEEEDEDEAEDEAATEIKRKDGEKIKLTFGTKKVDEAEKPLSPPLTDKDDSAREEKEVDQSPAIPKLTSEASSKVAPKPIGLLLNKHKNIFATAPKKNVFALSKKPTTATPQKPISEAERIMKEELEQKRLREANGGRDFKRRRIS
jgi:DNA/RNA-binding protein KIN17